jgi:hypothetical protein
MEIILMSDDATKKDMLKTPADVRHQISEWIAFACANGRLPFENGQGGVIIQALNAWQKSYENEKLAEIERRLDELDGKKSKKKSKSKKEA